MKYILCHVFIENDPHSYLYAADNRIQVGDFVMVPTPSSEKLAVGKVHAAQPLSKQQWSSNAFPKISRKCKPHEILAYCQNPKLFAQKEKASPSQVESTLRPFLHKPLLQKPYVEYKDIQTIGIQLLSRYSNVRIQPIQHSDHSYLEIQIKQVFKDKSLTYEIKKNGKSLFKNKSPKTWVDEIEEWEAILED